MKYKKTILLIITCSMINLIFTSFSDHAMAFLAGKKRQNAKVG